MVAPPCIGLSSAIPPVSHFRGNWRTLLCQEDCSDHLPLGPQAVGLRIALIRRPHPRQRIGALPDPLSMRRDQIAPAPPQGLPRGHGARASPVDVLDGFLRHHAFTPGEVRDHRHGRPPEAGGAVHVGRLSIGLERGQRGDRPAGDGADRRCRNLAWGCGTSEGRGTSRGCTAPRSRCPSTRGSRRVGGRAPPTRPPAPGSARGRWRSSDMCQSVGGA